MINNSPDTAMKLARILVVLTLVLAVLAALFIYKWGGAFRAVAAVQETRVYKEPPQLIPTADLPLLFANGARAINYLATVWPALVFGVLIAGLVRAFISARDVAELVGAGVLRQQLIGGAIGTPLMLCSCCIAPVFASFHAGGMRLSTSLAIMFSSPSLNVAALLLTFLLFPRSVALARVAMAIFAVVALPAIIERLAGRDVYAKQTGIAAGLSQETGPARPLELVRRWAHSSATIALTTLPLIVLGVFASGVLLPWLQSADKGAAPAGLIITTVALFATLIALPTFFEIPLGMLLLANGFPTGAVIAMLFAGPAINIPSLLTMARIASWKVAVFTLVGVWGTATSVGLMFELWR